jgi:hypothetical protein
MNQISLQISPSNHVIPVFIDEVKYELTSNQQSGAQLRALVPVAANLDLWLDTHGNKDDILIRPELPYDVKPGSQYYTAPSTINPGSR